MPGMFKTKINELDHLLKGGIHDGSMVVFWATPGIELAPFAYQILSSRLEAGDKAIYIAQTKRFELVLEEALKFGWNLSSFEKAKKLQCVDAHSSLLNTNPESEIVVKNAKQPKEITQGLEAALAKAGDGRKIIVFDSLETMLNFSGDKALAEMLNWRKLCQKHNATFFYLFTAYPFGQNIFSEVMKLNDVVVQLKTLESELISRNYFFVSKPLLTERGVPYKLVVPGGIKVFIPKILITGPFNAGKTSFVHSASIKSVSVDRIGTTVALDHGHVELKGFSIDLFGTPGQERFDPLLELLGGESVGVVVVIDSTDPKTFKRALAMLEKARVFGLPYVVAANKSNLSHALSLEKIKKLMGLPKDFPVIAVRAAGKAFRTGEPCPLKKEDIKHVFEALFKKLV